MNETEISKRLNRIVKNMNKLLLEVREDYPEANYMINGDSILIMVEGYSGNEQYSQLGALVHSDSIHHIDYGDWN